MQKNSKLTIDNKYSANLGERETLPIWWKASFD